jgi:hypothetical protein
MAAFLVQVFKTHPLENRPWSNVYRINAADLTAAVDGAVIIIPAEQAFHNAATQFTYARISSAVEGDDVYTTFPINEGGDRTDPADNLPLWNTVRVLINVFGGGRPSQKFYRLPLGEGDVNNYVIQSGVITLIQSTLTTLIDDMDNNGTPLQDPDGQNWGAVTVQERVQMRQLHRKRRRSTPA